MALRSRVSSIARPQPVSDADLAAAAGDQAEATLELITEPAPLGMRGVVREPVVETPVAETPAPSAQLEAPSAPVEAPVTERKRPGPKPGTPRKAAKTAPVQEEQAVTAPYLRGKLKDLEVTIKETRARHEQELAALRNQHRHLHDQLFDLTK